MFRCPAPSLHTGPVLDKAKGKAIKYMTDAAKSIASEAGLDDIDALTNLASGAVNDVATLVEAAHAHQKRRIFVASSSRFCHVGARSSR